MQPPITLRCGIHILNTLVSNDCPSSVNRLSNGCRTSDRGLTPDFIDLAHRLAPSHLFPYAYPEEIFRELRRVSRGSICDYSGISYERMDKEMGVFWPCPKEGHPGTPRLFEGGKFYHPDGRARFHGRVEKA